MNQITPCRGSKKVSKRLCVPRAIAKGAAPADDTCRIVKRLKPTSDKPRIPSVEPKIKA
jgi:hypothetical protein